jgi:hypothetical protein
MLWFCLMATLQEAVFIQRVRLFSQNRNQSTRDGTKVAGRVESGSKPGTQGSLLIRGWEKSRKDREGRGLCPVQAEPSSATAFVAVSSLVNVGRKTKHRG